MTAGLAACSSNPAGTQTAARASDNSPAAVRIRHVTRRHRTCGATRTDAVKERMTLLGVPAQRIETISFGEEKPRVGAETESAFAENRRADIVYSSR